MRGEPVVLASIPSVLLRELSYPHDTVDESVEVLGSSDERLTDLLLGFIQGSLPRVERFEVGIESSFNLLDLCLNGFNLGGNRLLLFAFCSKLRRKIKNMRFTWIWMIQKRIDAKRIL